MSKFYHDERVESNRSAEVIVPIVYQLLQPSSVVDLGCGSGSFLYQFKRKGVPKVLGLDGPWANRSVIQQYLSDEEFQAVDLEDHLPVKERFDLAINLEVAEHLSASSADRHVQNLVHLSDVILFSAAIPGQGGQNHLNEQWPGYWAEKFRAHDYYFHDILRPLIWGNPQVAYWYQQNVFLAVKKGIEPDLSLIDSFKNAMQIMDCVHPAVYQHKLDSLHRIKNLDIKTALNFLMRKLRK
jgi:SAM-dependent methyltransferase